MASASEPIVVALLALPEVTVSTLYGMFDLLSAAGRDWELLVHQRPGQSLIRPVVVTATGARFRTPSGIWVEPDCDLARCPEPALVCVPDALLAPGDDLRDRYEIETRWLRAMHERGALVATACAGALLLARAGLLRGQDATIHWAYCDAGTDAAMNVARCYLIDWHANGQLPYAVLTRGAQSDDPEIQRAQEWAAEHYDEDSPVTAMTELSGLPERSFKRRFTRATGMTPLEYVHHLRLEEAKQMLERSDASLEQIASEVGYLDGSFFSRLFKRKVGLTPAQYRRRFGSLRRAIGEPRPQVRR